MHEPAQAFRIRTTGILVEPDRPSPCSASGHTERRGAGGAEDVPSASENPRIEDGFPVPSRMPRGGIDGGIDGKERMPSPLGFFPVWRARKREARRNNWGSEHPPDPSIHFNRLPRGEGKRQEATPGFSTSRGQMPFGPHPEGKMALPRGPKGRGEAHRVTFYGTSTSPLHPRAGLAIRGEEVDRQRAGPAAPHPGGSWRHTREGDPPGIRALL